MLGYVWNLNRLERKFKGVMMEEKEKTIHDLKLHEYLRIEDNGNDFEVCVLRVPSGWNYEYYSHGELTTAFFVPWSSEFNDKAWFSKIEIKDIE
jgi:hypothetical protein